MVRNQQPQHPPRKELRQPLQATPPQQQSKKQQKQKEEQPEQKEEQPKQKEEKEQWKARATKARAERAKATQTDRIAPGGGHWGQQSPPFSSLELLDREKVHRVIKLCNATGRLEILTEHR